MLIISLFTLIFCVAFWVRCDNVLANRTIIFEAIRNYHVTIGAMPHEVSYSDMERSVTTFCRIWNWSYDHILPQEKYEIIKPYIGE
jgi:hypothetical protein